MSNMDAFFGKIDFLQGTPAVIILVITAVLLLYLKSWRGSLVVLIVQFLIAGLLFASFLEPQMAGIKLIVGLFVCLILYLTGSQVSWGEQEVDIIKDSGRPVSIGPLTVSSDTLVRSALALGVGAVALIFLPRSENAVLPGTVAVGAYVLVALGLIGLGYHLRPYKAGMGLLTFLTGFDLLYSALAFSNSLLIFFAAIQLVTALVISSMTHRRYTAAVQDASTGS